VRSATKNQETTRSTSSDAPFVLRILLYALAVIIRLRNALPRYTLKEC
jgi:hypothetical protein